MCGICGFAGFRNDERLSRMIASLVHRGPDDEGRHVEEAVSLGMRRLSVIDVAGGRQPIWNETRTVCVVMNGEIYNFQELRDRLIAQGHRFETKSDTEVLVHLYEEHGDACVKHLRGMFAFAIWDCTKQTLLLGRDRLGIKPLFYAEQAGRLWFASEIKALLAGGVEPRMDAQSLRQFLTFLYVPSPATSFEGMYQVPPGYTLTFARGKARLRRYWILTPDHETSGLDEGEAQAQLLARLKETVRLHLISDVPLGVFLSGGMDSSVIVALMREVSSGPIHTFTVGYGSGGKSFNELTFARLVANRFGTNHHEEIVEANAVELLPRIIRAFDEPFADSSAIPNYLIAQVARRSVTVALAGHGGDELFGGYPRYLGQQLGTSYDRLPAGVRRGLAMSSRWIPESSHSDNWPGRMRRFLETGTTHSAERYLRWITFLPSEWGEDAFTADFRAQFGPARPAEKYYRLYQYWDALDPAEQAMALDIQTYLPDDLLALGDRSSMAHSLEVRVPFCDHALVQFALGLPAEVRMRGWKLKYFLKQTVRRLLPVEILERPKQGFMVPVGRWLNHDLRPMVRELLSEDSIRRRGVVRYAYVRWLLEEHESGRRNFADQIYALLALEIWLRVYLERRPV
ncbi:MAG: asparagine synthase (glutamine-hydrolyzing) [Nitrospirae bacterium]|nr:MAG: asparagine synthase (glutamine-hydrolyzing) [Nitrospirota bacterium]